MPHRFMVEGSTGPPRSSMSAAPWRVLSGEATYQRRPISIISWGKWTPLPLLASVTLLHPVPWLTTGEHTVHRLKEKLRHNPSRSVQTWSVNPAVIAGVHDRHRLAEPVPLVGSGISKGWRKPAWGSMKL